MAFGDMVLAREKNKKRRCNGEREWDKQTHCQQDEARRFSNDARTQSTQTRNFLFDALNASRDLRAFGLLHDRPAQAPVNLDYSINKIAQCDSGVTARCETAFFFLLSSFDEPVVYCRGLLSKVRPHPDIQTRSLWGSARFPHPVFVSPWSTQPTHPFRPPVN